MVVSQLRQEIKEKVGKHAFKTTGITLKKKISGMRVESLGEFV